MRFSCGISSRSDFVKKFIEQFPPTKAQSTKSGCAFSLPAPHSEERRRAASEAAKKNSVNGMGRSVHKNLLRDIAQIKGFLEMVESAARVELPREEN
jgi:hypothetical protein